MTGCGLPQRPTGRGSGFRCGGVGPRRWVLTVLVIAISMSAAAQQWEFRPTFGVGASFDDNIRLDSAQSASGFGADIRAGASARRADDVSDLALSAELRLKQYAENSDLDNTAAVVSADWSYQTPRGEFQLDQSLTTQSTLTSELTTTGITNVNRQQYRYRLRPGWSYRLNEYTSLSLSAGYDDVFYDDVEGTGLTNYRSGSVSLSAGRRLSERLVLSLASSYGRFESQGNANKTQNIGFQLGAEYQVSERFLVSGLAGLRQTESELVDASGRRITEESSGPAFSLTARRRSARGAELRALAARELTPTGGSEVLDTTRLQLRYSYPVDERLRLRLSSQAYRNRQLGDAQARADRDYADTQIGLSYRLGPSLDINLDYRYRWRQLEGDAESASSNRLGLSLVWRGR